MPIADVSVIEDGVGGIKDYLDKTEDANANVLAAMNNGEKVADGERASRSIASGDTLRFLTHGTSSVTTISVSN